MKTKLLFICTLFLALSYSSDAQVYVYEGFDYTVGTNLQDVGNTNPITSTIWRNRSGGSPADMLIQDEPGWGTDARIGDIAFDMNSTGAAINFQGGGQNAVLDFDAVSGTGTSIYLSFLVDIKGWNATGGNNPSNYRLINLGINDSGNAGSGLFIGPGTDAPLTTFRFGLGNSDSKNSGDVAWETTNRDFTDLGADPVTVVDNQYFIVIKYTIGVGGGAPDGLMWINPAISATVPTATLSHEAVNKIRTSFETVLIEASSNDRTPDNFIDEIRVTGTWEEALGLPAPVASVKDNALSAALSVYPNPSVGSLNVSTNNISVKQVQLLDLTGKIIYSSSTNNTIDTSRMSKGLYLLKVTADDGATASRKVVLQ
jgi:hypothetical protein